MPEWEKLVGLYDPWGYELNLSTVRHARAWLSHYEPDGEWAWHPAMEETHSSMQRIIAEWPGDVCALCWEEWQGHGVHECEHWPTE